MTPTPLADQLRAAIDSSGLTAYALAKAAGVHPQLIGRWLKGERDLTLTSADKLAAALGIRGAKTISRKPAIPD